MDSYEYVVLKIEGEYATLKRTDINDDNTIFIALALLPLNIDQGTRLKWENMEYSIMQD